MSEENITVRDYVDTYSVKDFAVNEVMPKYFPDITPSNLTTGATGMFTELIATTVEDSFNTGSSLVAEAFPTRAKMESSIYANAAVFQLSNAFADAGRCKFIIALAEKDIKQNFQHKDGSSYSYFYLDKETKFYVNGIPFILDYDIEIRAMYRETRKKWVYSAKYLMDEYTNSVSLIKDPYVMLYNYADGKIALVVELRQYIRSIRYESIIDNATINYPTISVGYSGKLLGFDVLYKAPGDSGYNTQLATKVIYSMPSKDPFCYFKVTGSNSFELSFTTKDSYFQPEFNSELMIIVYTTEGIDGNFEYYDGDNISISKGDKYDYEYSWMIAAKPISGSTGGKERMDIEALQELTVEGYSTANALNTEHDLQQYFKNYKHRYGNEVLIMKKRNDAVELLFSAFMYIKKNDYIFPTNTLTLDTNIQYLDYKDGGFYNMDPGFLFGYKAIDAYFIPVFFMVTDGDGDKYDTSGHYIGVDGEYDSSKDITLHELQKKIAAGYVTETDHSYWRLVGNDGSKYYLYLSDGSLAKDTDPITQQELFTKFSNGELTYGTIDSTDKTVDFLMDFEKDAKARKDYISYFSTFKETKERPDMTFDEYLFEYTFKDYKRDNSIDTRRTIFNTDIEEYAKTQKFMFTNPFITTIAKDTGLISYYQSFISQDAVLDFVKENDDDAFVQFISYTFHIERDITSDKRYKMKVVVLPSVPADDEDGPYCELIYDEADNSQFILYDGATPGLENFDKSKLSANRVRMLVTFTDDGLDLGYIELIPTNVSKEGQITFEGVIYTDDYITSANTMRHTHICPKCGHQILNSANANIEGLNYYCDNCGEKFKEGIINIRESDSMLLPISNALLRITTIYKDPEKDVETTDNVFAQYDDSYKGYIWTNIYNTLNDPVTLLQPLEMMRSAIVYKDYYVTGVDALDCTISDVPLLKYSILAYKDEGMSVTDPLLSDDVGKFQYFMDAFLNNYDVLKEAKQMMNGMHIDAKFYNSYGRSTNFDIGENGEVIDTNNISIYFDVYVISNTDTLAAESELKLYIKDYIETINEDGSNDLYISNLITDLENHFSYVHHLYFKGINSYDTTYQAIINRKIGLENLTKEERRNFVPDILVVNTNNIVLDFYQDET